jgi:hypothetical protein
MPRPGLSGRPRLGRLRGIRLLLLLPLLLGFVLRVISCTLGLLLRRVAI